MAEESAGTISYTVDVETGGLLTGNKALNQSMDQLESKFKVSDAMAKKLEASENKLSKAVKDVNASVKNQSSAFSSLTKVVAGYLTLQAFKNAMQLADQYTDMASRIRNVTVSTQEYEEVQKRLLETANGTYRALNEAQEVYLSTAETLKDLGYNTEQVLDITDSMSYAFVRDAARADQARNAMDAYSKSLMKGKIDADAWASVIAATPSVVAGIASATGESTLEIKRLGAEGKLSIEALNEGFRQSLDVNKEFAAQMDATGRDAFVQLENSFQVFIGKVNEASGATAGIVSSVALLSEALQDPEVIQAAQDLAAGVVTAFTAMVNGAKEVVKFTKWAAEEVAAVFGGVSADDIVRLEQKLAKLQERLESSGKTRGGMSMASPELKKEIAETQKLIDEYYKRQEESAKSATEQTNKSTEANNKQAESVKNLVSATDTKKESDKKAAEQAKELANAIKQNQEFITRLGDELRLAALSGEDLAVAQAKLSLNKFATPEDVAEVERITRALYEQDQVIKNSERAKQLDPAMGAQASFDKDMEDLRKLNEAKIIEDQRYLELKTQLETEYNQRMMQIEEERFAAQSRTNQLMIDSLNEMQAAGTAALTGLLTGTNNLTDAMQQLGAGILHHAVSALVEMGIQHVKSIIMGQSAQAAAAASTTALASTISTAMATPAALTSLATSGSNAVGAQAGIASTVGMANALSVAGGRLYGGQTTPGQLYRVNENGAPEIFSAANGKQYMMPNTRGEVISNRDATAGAGNIYNIAINIDSAGGTTVTENGGSADDARALAFSIRTAVISEIEKQTRQGGMIRNFVKNGSV